MEVQALCACCWRELTLSRSPRAQRHGAVTWHCPHCELVIATLDRGVIRPYARARLTTSGQDRTSRWRGQQLRLPERLREHHHARSFAVIDLRA